MPESTCKNFNQSLIEKEINHFRDLCHQLIKKYQGDELYPDIFLIGDLSGYDVKKNHQDLVSNNTNTNNSLKNPPKDEINSFFKSVRSKQYPLVFSALIHGNEVAGICSLNIFLEYLVLNVIELTFPLVVFLGNVQAAMKGVRYVVRDLNRCFDLKDQVTDQSTVELARVGELKKILSDSSYYLDLHQTIGTCPYGFFIFSYKDNCYHFAKSIAPKVKIVTYWTGNYTSEGMCSDQFVQENGGVAVTLELGDKGFIDDKISLGTQTLISAFCYVKHFIVEQKHSGGFFDIHSGFCLGDIYTWSLVVPYPPKGEVMPKLDFANFQYIKKGEEIAKLDGEPIYSSVSGYVLFASMVHSKEQDLYRPHELIRILKIVKEDDLPFSNSKS